MNNLNNKVAVVTGAGSGIGRSLAKSLAARGCRLALSDVNEAGLAETAASLNGTEVNTYRLDVSDRDAIYAHAEQVRKDFWPGEPDHQQRRCRALCLRAGNDG